MAADTLPSPRTNTAQAAEFFKLSGRYVIDPATTTAELLDDLGVLLESSVRILDLVDEDDKDRAGIWPALFMLRQAYALYCVGASRMGSNWQPKADHER